MQSVHDKVRVFMSSQGGVMDVLAAEAAHTDLQRRKNLEEALGQLHAAAPKEWDTLFETKVKDQSGIRPFYDEGLAPYLTPGLASAVQQVQKVPGTVAVHVLRFGAVRAVRLGESTCMRARACASARVHMPAARSTRLASLAGRHSPDHRLLAHEACPCLS